MTVQTPAGGPWDDLLAAVAVPEDDSTATVLAAARASVLAVGARRTTLTDVARRAGVSRMTVYRRFPDVTTLVAELLTRELADVLRAARERTQTERHGRARLVEAGVAIVSDLEEHPLLRKVLDVDPELLLPYVTDRLGSTQRLGHAAVTRLVAEGQADGSIRAGDPEQLAAGVLLVTQSFVLSATPVAALLPRADRLALLRRFLDAPLRPDDA